MKNRFICYRCPKCGRIQGAISRQDDIYKVILKCKNERCKKSTQLKNKVTGYFKADVWFCETEKALAEKVASLKESEF